MTKGNKNLMFVFAVIAINIAVIVAGAIAQMARAEDYNSQSFGNQTYYNGSDGYNGNSQTFGNQTYYHDNRGNNCTTSRYGSMSYTNCD
jgi:type II secretory pathway pseudopilin PulG